MTFEGVLLPAIGRRLTERSVGGSAETLGILVRRSLSRRACAPTDDSATRVSHLRPSFFANRQDSHVDGVTGLLLEWGRYFARDDQQLSDVSPLTAALLRLSQAPGVGTVLLRQALEQARRGTLPSDPLDLLPADVAEKAATSEEWVASGDFLVGQLEAARRFQTRIIGPLDPEYPPALRSNPDVPPVLYIRGMLMPFIQRSVAVIGTRHPTRHGASTAWRLGRYFAEHACSVVSGLAVGCDTFAHGGALEAEGHTVAVLAHGLQTIAPRENAGVAEAIVDGGGALVTEFPFGTKPAGFRYVQRDRTQAALSNGVVLVQSKQNGGSLHASRAALRYGRWLAVAGATEQDIADGAPVIEANQILTHGSDTEKSLLLRVSAEQLKHVHVLSGKSDYENLLPLLWRQDRANDTELFNDADDLARRALHRREP